MGQMNKEKSSILVVSDEQDILSLIERDLIKCGYKHIKLEPEILNAVDLFERGERYDLAFLSFPPSKAKRIYVLLDFIKHKSPVTTCMIIPAVQDADIAAECLKRGAAAVLTLPISDEQITKAISKTSDTVHANPVTSEQIRILILEDDPVSGALIAKHLEPYGWCDVYRDGRSAVDSFRKAIWGNRYHLVILDIMVPEIHGREVLRLIRETEQKKGISSEERAKIIMTTALSDAGNIIESFKAACDSYLIKPIEKGKLISEIKSLGLLKDINPKSL
jgi:two-component system, chemotaxis family, chemotaxis protein CheY